MAALKEQTDRQLGQLYEQMQTLVKQAHDIKQRVEISKKIYWSQMNFEPVISKEYYLYEKKVGYGSLHDFTEGVGQQITISAIRGASAPAFRPHLGYFEF
jgi:hypothetical protein